MLKRHPVHLLTLLVAVVLVYLSGRMLLADVFAYQAASFESDWSAHGVLTSDEAWLVAHGAATQSVALFPVPNGELYDRLGRIHEWQHRGDLPGGAEAMASRLQALSSYRTAVASRSEWPYGWVRLARIKFSLLQFDEEFDRALRQAFSKGQWRWRVNADLTRIGLLSWHELNPEQKQLIAKSFTHLRTQRPKEAEAVLRSAERFQVSDELSNYINEIDSSSVGDRI